MDTVDTGTVSETPDQALKFFTRILQSVIGIIILLILYKGRRRILYLLTGDEYIRASWRDCFCCKALAVCPPLYRMLGLRVIPVRIIGMTLDLSPASKNASRSTTRELGSNLELFFRIDNGNNPTKSTRVKSGKAGMRIVYTDEFEFNVREGGGNMIFYLMEQDVMFHDSMGTVSIDPETVVYMAKTGYEETFEVDSYLDVGGDGTLGLLTLRFMEVREDEEEMEYLQSYA
jgi:hypothetical protein